jgi:probable HAF family extracellular repeat protein
MQDLGTLGGPDAFAFSIDDSGTVLGFSYTSYKPGPTGVPPIDPFLWENNRMLDLGTLGGTAGFPNSFNHHNQVVGQSNLAGDVQFRPFLWEHGVMTALGTFLGPGHPSDGAAFSINDSGEAVGWADNQNNDYAAAWKNAVTTNLGTVGGDSCAYANSVNSKGQIVGRSGLCLIADAHAFLREEGGPLVDLNTLVALDTGVHLTSALFINDNGEIAAIGLLENGDQHAFVLIPCDSNESGEVCDYSLVDGNAGASVTPPRSSRASGQVSLPAAPCRHNNWFHLPVVGPHN